jgi:hypothetical protein
MFMNNKLNAWAENMSKKFCKKTLRCVLTFECFSLGYILESSSFDRTSSVSDMTVTCDILLNVLRIQNCSEKSRFSDKRFRYNLLVKTNFFHSRNSARKSNGKVVPVLN